MPIQFEIDRDRNLTTFTLQGQVKLAEMLEALNAYGKGGVTLNELYDVRQLAGERISAEDIEAVANYFKQYGRVRPDNSKTAILVTNELDYGLSRMIQLLTDGSVPFRINVFRTLESAMAWLATAPIKE